VGCAGTRDPDRAHHQVIAHTHRANEKAGGNAGLFCCRRPESLTARGYDAGKRIYGRKRHIVTDTNGLLLAVYVHPANVQDCHGAVPLLERLRSKFPKLRHIFADRIYRGNQLVNALAPCGPWTIEIVERPQGVKGFQLLPRRWVVERTFAWFGRCRRLSKDFEGSAATETAWLLVAHLRLLTRRLAAPKILSAL
jgi:putative transposase